MTVVTNGVDSEAEPLAGEAVPLAQLTLTLTEAALLSEKSLLTVNVALFSELTIVQAPAATVAVQPPLEV